LACAPIVMGRDARILLMRENEAFCMTRALGRHFKHCPRLQSVEFSRPQPICRADEDRGRVVEDVSKVCPANASIAGHIGSRRQKTSGIALCCERLIKTRVGLHEPLRLLYCNSHIFSKQVSQLDSVSSSRWSINGIVRIPATRDAFSWSCCIHKENRTDQPSSGDRMLVLALGRRDP
jgi:hypothetical protein